MFDPKSVGSRVAPDWDLMKDTPPLDRLGYSAAASSLTQKPRQSLLPILELLDPFIDLIKTTEHFLKLEHFIFRYINLNVIKNRQ